MKILFFAALRETMDQSEMNLAVDGEITLGQLKSMIKTPSGATLNDLSKDQSLMAAVDQEMVDDLAMVTNDSEVAFFPPVTGG